MKLNIQEPDRPIREQTVAGDVVRVGRDVSCEIAFDEERFPKVSGLHAEFQRRGKDVFIVHRSRSNRTLYNEQPLAVETKVKPGDRIRLGFTGPELIVVSLSEAKSVAPIAADASQETRMAVNGAEVLRGSAQFRSMPIGHFG